MKIFLSYAREDAETASVIHNRLHSAHHVIFDWQTLENGGDRFIEASEEAIRGADYFFAVLSPSFLASSWCREERNFALRREHERSGRAPFIHVLQVSEVNPRDAGYLGSYDWRDLTRPDLVAVELDALLEKLADAERRAAGAGDPGEPRAARGGASGEPVFHNREDELEKVLRALANAAGPHFWLVVAPPQLGKTWFLDRICKDLRSQSSGEHTGPAPGWLINRIDLREQAPEVRADADKLLGLMFRRSLVAVNLEELRKIAIEIIQSRQPHLCVLDNAELLDARTVGGLREHLSPIYQWVLEAGLASSRLAVIVASRKDEGWGGLSPDPRLSHLSLTEFTVDVVQKALREMAEDRNLGAASYRRYAVLAHGLTEGLPALLARCLQWIVAEQWTDLDRMVQPDTFRMLAKPYIESELLTSESLFPGYFRQHESQLLALQYAYRLLAPYRLFTHSHLQHHLEGDPDLTDTLGRLGWSVTHLWQAMIGTSLLTRPRVEMWQQIHPAVRRLLYRYFYEFQGDAAGASIGAIDAHREASRFIKIWGENQAGKEQVVGLVESLWHDANVLLHGGPEEAAKGLALSARQLSEDLRPSPAYTLGELRQYAEERMRADDELQRALSHIDGLFERLVEIVLRP